MANNVLPTTTEEALSIVRSAAPKYWKGESDLTMRYRMVLALMQKWGTIDLNADCTYAGVWNVKYKNPPVRVFVDRANISFNATQLREQLVMSVESYEATDSMSKHEIVKIGNNKNKIIDLYKKKSADLLQTMRNNMCAEFFNDGYTNTSRFKGLESFFGTGTTVAADKVAEPSDNYGDNSLSTALGNKGGNWSSDLSTSPNANAATDWPFGQGDAEYDYISPLVLNTSSTSWQNGGSWLNDCEEIMQYMKIAQRHRVGKMKTTNSPFVHLLGTSLYNDFETYFRARNQQFIPIKEAQDLGFPETLNFDGTWVTHDYDVGSAVGYYLCPEMMEFFTPQPQLFDPEGPKWSTENQAVLYIVTQFGNYRFQPKFFGKYAAVA